MTAIPFLLLAVLAGLSNPVQTAANTQMNKIVGQVALAGFLIYGVAFATLLVLSPAIGLSFRDATKIGNLPWWAWIGGLCNLAFLISAAIATKPLGSGTFTVVSLTCAIVLSIVLDQFGLLGLEQRSITVWRVLGGAMAIGGAILVAKF